MDMLKKTCDEIPQLDYCGNMICDLSKFGSESFKAFSGITLKDEYHLREIWLDRAIKSTKILVSNPKPPILAEQFPKGLRSLLDKAGTVYQQLTEKTRYLPSSYQGINRISGTGGVPMSPFFSTKVELSCFLPTKP